ncbi:hypothetical protein BDQ17DRAFT_533370 [Cyathus striatus]|nr:hypothetical protein BDQ17DRAFT_533370 [Cyathus striatus]
MPPAFLAVFSEPGTEVGLEEFQDWYDNEHVPARMHILKEFLSGARFSAADGKKPSWAALYEIDDTSTFEKDVYTRLRVERSIREAQIIKRLEVLDRRTGEVIYDSGASAMSSSFEERDPSRVVVTPGYLAVHEFLNLDDVDEFVERIGDKAVDLRRWNLYRAYPGIAQGNVKDAITENWK